MVTDSDLLIINRTNHIFQILELGPVSHESPGNFTFYRVIDKFLNPTIFAKITVFFSILCCNCHFTENSVKWQQQHKNHYFYQN